MLIVIAKRIPPRLLSAEAESRCSESQPQYSAPPFRRVDSDGISHGDCHDDGDGDEDDHGDADVDDDCSDDGDGAGHCGGGGDGDGDSDDDDDDDDDHHHHDDSDDGDDDGDGEGEGVVGVVGQPGPWTRSQMPCAD